MLNEVLSASGVEPEFFDNGQAALQRIESKQFDCICVSRYIGDGEGIALAKELRERLKNKYIPILLLTSEEDNTTYSLALEAGVTEVFHKRDIHELLHFLQRLNIQNQPLHGRVLYVEDTISQQTYVTQLFTQKGLSVDAFVSGEEAWAAFLKEDYDLVVTDVLLEGNMSGMALTNRIRRIGEDKGDVPILAITGYDDIARRVELFHLGISDYVIKPVIEEELMARVRNLIQQKQFLDESKHQRQLKEQANISKSEFISHMNHELRTPLNAILGFTELLLTDNVEQTSLQKNAYNQIKSAGDHLLSLVDDITHLTKVESGALNVDVKDVYLKAVLDSCVSKLSVIADNLDVNIEAYSISPMIKVKADPLRLNQILLNLLSNAIKYNKPGGRVKISHQVLDNGYIRIGIKDSGIGIAEDNIPNLFKPFSRLSDSRDVEGTGLGLVICQRFVDLMHGEMGMKSKLGSGSTFWIDLPA
jgi:signal transduction histidine kinase